MIKRGRHCINSLGPLVRMTIRVTIEQRDRLRKIANYNAILRDSIDQIQPELPVSDRPAQP